MQIGRREHSTGWDGGPNPVSHDLRGRLPPDHAAGDKQPGLFGSWLTDRHIRIRDGPRKRVIFAEKQK